MSVMTKLGSLVIDYLKTNKKEEHLPFCHKEKPLWEGGIRKGSNTLLESVTCAFPEEMQEIRRLSSKNL